MSLEPVTPTSLLRRAGRALADRIAVIDGERRTSYAGPWSRVGRR